MDSKGVDSYDCKEEARPASKRPCVCEGRQEEAEQHNKLVLVQDEPSDRKCTITFASTGSEWRHKLFHYS